jgi:hypothetical protein
MTFIILIDKYGKIKEQNIKKFHENDLYKKAGFKTDDHFTKRHTWENIKCNTRTYDKISIYAKNQGTAGRENKYDLPPPIDNVLYFGTMVITCYNSDGILTDLTKDHWKEVYESLFGGFEDLGDEDEEEEEEEEEHIDPNNLTKQGYLKDDFIVDDDDCEDEEWGYESELSEDEYFD